MGVIPGEGGTFFRILVIRRGDSWEGVENVLKKSTFSCIIHPFQGIGRDLGKSTNFVSQNPSLDGLEIRWQILEELGGGLQLKIGEYIYHVRVYGNLLKLTC